MPQKFLDWLTKQPNIADKIRPIIEEVDLRVLKQQFHSSYFSDTTYEAMRPMWMTFHLDPQRISTFINNAHFREYLQRMDFKGIHIQTDLSDTDLAILNLNLKQAILRNNNLSRTNLSGLDLEESDFSGAHLNNANLDNTHLSKANFTDASLTGASLIGADLSGSDLSGANLSGTNLSGANLSNANLNNTHLSKANFTGASLTGANLRGVDLTWAIFCNTDLDGIIYDGQTKWPAKFSTVNIPMYSIQPNSNLRKANLSGTNLSNADLSGSDLSGANLSGANLSGANLSNANLDNTNLYETDLTNTNLHGCALFSAEDVNWSVANLSGTNLSDIDLFELDFSQMDLSNAILTNSDLSEANLSEANLSGSDLSGANLSGANLSGANLSNAHLTNTNLNGAILVEATIDENILQNGSLIHHKKTIWPNKKVFLKTYLQGQLEPIFNSPVSLNTISISQQQQLQTMHPRLFALLRYFMKTFDLPGVQKSTETWTEYYQIVILKADTDHRLRLGVSWHQYALCKDLAMAKHLRCLAYLEQMLSDSDWPRYLERLQLIKHFDNLRLNTELRKRILEQYIFQAIIDNTWNFDDLRNRFPIHEYMSGDSSHWQTHIRLHKITKQDVW